MRNQKKKGKKKECRLASLPFLLPVLCVCMFMCVCVCDEGKEREQTGCFEKIGKETSSNGSTALLLALLAVRVVRQDSDDALCRRTAAA